MQRSPFSLNTLLLLTLASPMTIVFFTSLFTAKALEYNYTKKHLWIFGLAVALATFIFMGTSVVLFFQLKGAMSTIIIQALNGLVGLVLIVYGGARIVKIYACATP